MEKMTIVEIRSAIAFGKEVIEQYKSRNEEIPSFVYERIIELQEQLISIMSSEEE